jgi:hypothetical protein
MAAEPRDLRPHAAEISGFLMANLPRLDQEDGWDHMFSTAYQIGCMALAALGNAEETTWGALRRAVPLVPDVLPGWDDICVAVLWLACQQNRLTYLRQDGRSVAFRAGTFFVVPATPRSPPVPNITAMHGLGSALADEDTQRVLQSLGLVLDGAWTAAAEPVLWRCQPPEWELQVERDSRFADALDVALASMPADVRAEIARLATVSEDDVQAYLAENAKTWQPLAHQMQTSDRPHLDQMEIARKMVASQRHNALDWLFYRRWRLAIGWLSDAEIHRALEIFNDPLAGAMRRAVVCRLHPDSPVAVVSAAH